MGGNVKVEEAVVAVMVAVVSQYETDDEGRVKVDDVGGWQGLSRCRFNRSLSYSIGIIWFNDTEGRIRSIRQKY